MAPGTNRSGRCQSGNLLRNVALLGASLAMFGLFVSIGEGLRFITKENSTGLRHLIGRAVSGASPLVSAAWFWCIRQDANHQVAGYITATAIRGSDEPA